MSSTLKQVRDEVAVALATAGVTVYPTIPATPELPCVVVAFPNRIEFNRTAGGLAEFDMSLSIYVGMTDVDYAQEQLDGFVTGTMKGLLESHTTSVWRAMVVTSASNFRSESFGEATALGADLNLTLIA